MLKALSQFMVMLTSSNSKFDHYRRNEAGGSFTTDEAAGILCLIPNALPAMQQI
jgi:cytochrome c peroxidase